MRQTCSICGRPAENIRKPWGWRPVHGPLDLDCCFSCAASNATRRDDRCWCDSCYRTVNGILGLHKARRGAR